MLTINSKDTHALISPKNIVGRYFLLTPIVLGIMADQGFSQTTEIESIIVTGQKIERSLQDTTTSVAVITETQMEEQHITNFKDVLTETANAFSTPSGEFTIRGINAGNVSGGGNSYLASVYVDGAVLPRGLIRSGAFSTWDAQQVEILRGPQSTLQGRNALAGAVMMTTQRPEHEWSARFRLQGGQHGEQEAAVAFGGGLIEDTLAFRFSAEQKEIEGENINITRNIKSNYREDDLYRLKLLLEPKSLPDFSAQFSYTHATHENGPVFIDKPSSGSPFEQRTVDNDTPNRQNNDADVYTLVMDYKLNDNWDVTVASSYSDSLGGYVWDADQDPSPSLIQVGKRPVETDSHELRFTFDYEKLSGVFGGYYFDQSTKNTFLGQSLLNLAQVGLSSAFLQAQYSLDASTAALVVNQYAALDPVQLAVHSESLNNVQSSALFADMRYQINDRWDIFGGVRWDNESQENSNSQELEIENEQFIPDPNSYLGTPFAGIIPLITGINSLLYAQAATANNFAPLTSADFKTFLPKLGATFHWTEELSTSFTYQEGYRSGGVGTNTATALVYQFEPEYTDNYELSLRSSWLDNKLTINANAFYIDWTAQQVSVQLSSNTFDTETRNAGSSTVKGLEVDLNYFINDNIRIYGSLGQAKSEFTDFIITIPTGGESISYDLAGRKFSGSPEWTSNVGITYSDYSGFFANVSANYASGSPANLNPYASGLVEGDDRFDLQNDSRVLMNLQLGYEWEKVGVYLIGRNILDEEHIASNGREFLTLGDSRQLSLSVRGSF